MYRMRLWEEETSRVPTPLHFYVGDGQAYLTSFCYSQFVKDFYDSYLGSNGFSYWEECRYFNVRKFATVGKLWGSLMPMKVPLSYKKKSSANESSKKVLLQQFNRARKSTPQYGKEFHSTLYCTVLFIR